MMTTMEKELCVPLSVDFTQQAADFLDACLAETAEMVSPRLANRLHIATDEVASNLLAYSGAAKVKFRCTARDGEIVLTFCDDGVPYNPLTQALPDVSANTEERPIGGLGLLLVKRLMSEVHYERCAGQNVLTLRMLLS